MNKGLLPERVELDIGPLKDNETSRSNFSENSIGSSATPWCGAWRHGGGQITMIWDATLVNFGAQTLSFAHTGILRNHKATQGNL